jgi:hypothetical protein
MSINEQIDILRRGVATWNKWRQEHPLSRVDLSGANFIGADFSGVDFSGADLIRANLSGADLNGANLSGADLMGADLSRADLIGVDLRRARLSGANLTRANLTRANLTQANLSSATLSKTELGDAILAYALLASTHLADIDLSSVKGLETAEHLGPSSIGTDTLYLSGAQIPSSFLRGAGMQEVFIQYMPSLVAQPIEFYSVFISYSHADKAFARRLHDTLQGRGIRCWLDEHQLLPGDDIYEQVDRGIRLWDKVLLCCSKHSLTSWWVISELEAVIRKERIVSQERGKPVLGLIPLNLDGYMFKPEWSSSWKEHLTARLAVDFTGWEYDNAKFEEQFERVVKALRTDDGGRELAPPSKL